MTFAQSERAALCDLFDRLGSDAPTLCQGWDTHDLASHLWIRENDPLVASGISVKPLSGLNERRMAEVRQRWVSGARLDVGEFKDLTRLSRKYVIPLLEYLDREKITRRSGADRVVL